MPGPKIRALTPLDARAASLYDHYRLHGEIYWSELDTMTRERWRNVAREAWRYVKNELEA